MNKSYLPAWVHTVRLIVRPLLAAFGISERTIKIVEGSIITAETISADLALSGADKHQYVIDQVTRTGEDPAIPPMINLALPGIIGVANALQS